MTTITTIKKRNADAGHHFFDEAAMRFFNSRVSRTTYGDYFVTSEKGPSDVRLYTVRYSNPDTGHVDTVGEFQQYDSLWAALEAARRLHLAVRPI